MLTPGPQRTGLATLWVRMAKVTKSGSKSDSKATSKSPSKAGGGAGRKAPAKAGGMRVAKPRAGAPAEAAEVATIIEAPPPPRRDLARQAERARAFSIEAARLLLDDKCTEIVVLDVRSLSQVSDFLVIGSGTSDRQMRSCLAHVEEFGVASGHRVMRSIADEAANWLVADCVDVVIHLFEPLARSHYDLESLWGDAPRVAWERAAGEAPPEAKPRRRTVVRQEAERGGE